MPPIFLLADVARLLRACEEWRRLGLLNLLRR